MREFLQFLRARTGLLFLAIAVLTIVVIVAGVAIAGTYVPARQGARPGCMTTNTSGPDRPGGTAAIIQVTYCGRGIRNGSWWCSRTADRKHVTLRCREVSRLPYRTSWLPR